MMDDSTYTDAVDPTDPPERQELEHRLAGDQHIEQELHYTIEQEQILADAAEHAGRSHHGTDTRIQELENKEQVMAGQIVEDQQAIAHWDHAHPGWDQAEAEPAEDAAPAEEATLVE